MRTQGVAVACCLVALSCTNDVFTADDGGDAATTDGNPDAIAIDAPIDLDACAKPTAFYFDGDGDGYGGATTMLACSAPSTSWVTKTGDCDDANADVHPGQPNFFTIAYMPSGATQASFDYDCDGTEVASGDPSAVNCHDSNLTCVGSGYLLASPVRSGAGVNPLCGSTQAELCSSGLSGCTASAPQTASAVACH